MKQRLFLSVLCILFLMYDAMPRFQIDLTMEGAFFSLWLLFAMMALGGNLAGLFFGKREIPFRVRLRILFGNEKKTIQPLKLYV